MPTSISPASERPSINTNTADSRLEIDATRARQTEKPPAPFRDVLAGGVSLLMSGAEIATHVVAGPVMAASVHDARVGAVSSISGGPGSAGGFSSAGGVGAGGIAALGPAGMSGPLAAAAGAPGSSDLTNVQGMMQDGQSSNMQMLALQQQIQEESQRFTTVSNVMRAKYDTAKAAVSNIRA
ncbi:MAG TPA: hypothetical protein VH853_03275 [Polyangia bacterium]|jgi:hypothetical protein|nr:hypothetical protein [Polyangia bacterium]